LNLDNGIEVGNVVLMSRKAGGEIRKGMINMHLKNAGVGGAGGHAVKFRRNNNQLNITTMGGNGQAPSYQNARQMPMMGNESF